MNELERGGGSGDGLGFVPPDVTLRRHGGAQAPDLDPGCLINDETPAADLPTAAASKGRGQ